MVNTVLANPGSIGVSFAGVTDKFQIIANILMLGDQLLGFTTGDDDIIHALKKDGLEPSTENIAKVKAFFSSTLSSPKGVETVQNYKKD
jgi:hypothetical protein